MEIDTLKAEQIETVEKVGMYLPGVPYFALNVANNSRHFTEIMPAIYVSETFSAPRD